MTIDDMIAMLQAAKAGKTIQAKLAQCPPLHLSERWVDFDLVHHVRQSAELRVKPEPLEGWVNIYDTEPFASRVHTTREEADRAALAPRIRCVHVREVTEE